MRNPNVSPVSSTVSASQPEQAQEYFLSQQLSAQSDDALLQEAYELRYEVYCDERKFLPCERYPDRKEIDDFDLTCGHFVAFNRNDELVGYSRLANAIDGVGFPFQAHGTQLLKGVVLPADGAAREISRLMVRRDYRRRRGDMIAGATDPDTARTIRGERRQVSSPRILLSLYREMYRHSLLQNIRYWYAAMELPLARALAQLNFRFQPISPEADYYGPVTTYIADLRAVETLLAKAKPDLLAWLQSPRSESRS